MSKTEQQPLYLSGRVRATGALRGPYAEGRVWTFGHGDVWCEFYSGFANTTVSGSIEFMRAMGEHLIKAADAAQAAQGVGAETELKARLNRETSEPPFGQAGGAA